MFIKIFVGIKSHLWELFTINQRLGATVSAHSSFEDNPCLENVYLALDRFNA
jgi:hypothetical protein